MRQTQNTCLATLLRMAQGCSVCYHCIQKAVPSKSDRRHNKRLPPTAFGAGMRGAVGPQSFWLWERVLPESAAAEPQAARRDAIEMRLRLVACATSPPPSISMERKSSLSLRLRYAPPHLRVTLALGGVTRGGGFAHLAPSWAAKARFELSKQ